MAFDNCAPVRRSLYALNFFLTISLALTSYFNTPLLISRGISEWSLGIVYAASSAIVIFFLLFAPRLFNEIGGFESFAILATLNAFALIGLGVTSGTMLTLFFFISLIVLSSIVFLLLDMFLEGSTSHEGETGGTRAFFITMATFAWVGAPFVAGQLSVDGNFLYLYVFAASVFIPVLLITAKSLHGIVDRVYVVPNIPKMIATFTESKDTRNVFVSHFLLRIFYAIMVVYAPIYLINYAGFSFSEMGIILSIAMLAFILFEIPAGRIGDKYLGEKEIMVLGLIILSVSTFMIAQITEQPLLVWAMVLFTTRAGAALLEISTESYFFKRVGSGDADKVGAFRALSPLSYIVGPLFGTVALLFVSVPNLFALLAVILILGIPFAISLKDTK
ncbi:hypothetical protein COU13_00595 [Candidatus Kaiserbacteria bacterium CG10_big_fil_rev_8_21_14_0_10_43_70]|uniref:Major facilitator superfamily (MFS) profile domain-containing protein n=1 Tax=Candidatus Kaiserbacteria bacterium CG10_big_fil_rev_8_21_14_0_10_43_70 TaxID=1974605 RepID=A0A2H0UJB4_9BACT|nr:MAG: hypothetical protein COU13_00595 [Candidatus Kaiserbacteria bacterium CG10_big_fil_rev_8_21_14_0_10_43_70]